MKVSKIILENLRNNKLLRLKTALALEVGERTIQNYIEANSDNLTKAAAVKVYKSEGLIDEDIFESDIL